MSEVVLASRGLAKTFGIAQAAVPVLRGIDLEVRRGDCLAIVGASGSGKSTLLDAWRAQLETAAVLAPQDPDDVIAPGLSATELIQSLCPRKLCASVRVCRSQSLTIWSPPPEAR